MSKPLNLTEVATLVDGMTNALAGWDDRTCHEAKGSHDWFARLSDATAILRSEVEAIGGRFSDPGGDGIAVQLGGIRSSSTSGVHGACRNWLTAARKKLEAPDI